MLTNLKIHVSTVEHRLEVTPLVRQFYSGPNKLSSVILFFKELKHGHPVNAAGILVSVRECIVQASTVVPLYFQVIVFLGLLARKVV